MNAYTIKKFTQENKIEYEKFIIGLILFYSLNLSGW